MKSLVYTLIVLVSLFAMGCGGASNTTETNASGNGSNSASPGSGSDAPADTASSTAGAIASPSDAIKTIVEGVRAKDSEMIRSALSKKTLERFDELAKEENKSFYEIFVADDFEEMSKLPALRNEKIDGDKATLEFQNDNTKEWDTLPFLKEDGSWKLAIGDGAPEEDM